MNGSMYPGIGQASLDPNSPYMQQLAITNPVLFATLAQQQAQQAPQMQAAMPVANLTSAQIMEIVDARIKEAAAKTQAATPAIPAAIQELQTKIASFDQVFQHALSNADYTAFQEYVKKGSPGFSDMLKSNKLHPIAQLLWETIKENTK